MRAVTTYHSQQVAEQSDGKTRQIPILVVAPVYFASTCLRHKESQRCKERSRRIPNGAKEARAFRALLLFRGGSEFVASLAFLHTHRLGKDEDDETNVDEGQEYGEVEDLVGRVRRVQLHEQVAQDRAQRETDIENAADTREYAGSASWSTKGATTP